MQQPRHRGRVAAIAAVGALALTGGAVAAHATGVLGGGEGPEHETKVTGTQLDKASKAALAEVGSGKVTGNEKNDEEGAAFQIEVTKADGSQVDVDLDKSYTVIKTKADGHEGTDEGAKSDGETSDDATDTGPDANPNEPGHQDASDAKGGDGDGEVAD